MKNLILKSSFHEKLKMLLIAIGLMVTSLTTQVWAAVNCDLVSSGDVNRAMPNYEAGYNMGSINVWFSINGASYSSKSSSESNINQDRAISASNITSGLKFNKFSVPVYCHNQWHGDACSNNGARIVNNSLEMSWKVSNPSGTQVGSGSFTTTTNVSLSWSGNGATGTWTSNQSEQDLLSGVTASTSSNQTYTMDFWYKFQCHMYNKDGNDWGSNVNVWYPGGEDHFKYQFTIPKTTLTVNTSGDNGSATASSGISGSIALNTDYTLTASDVTGYNFVNWTTSDGSITITSPTSRTGAKVKFTSFTSATITANYAPKTTTVTLNANAPSGETVTGGGTTVTATYDAALPSFSALTCTGGYNLTGYYTSSDVKVIEASGTFAANSGIWNRTDGATLTLYAHWNKTNSLTVSAGANISSVTGTTSPVTLGNKYPISATPNTGYTFSGWTASPAANGTFDNANSASTNVTVKNGSVTVTGAATENMTTVTVNVNPASAGTLTVGGSAFTPGNSTSAGVSTSRTVVATPASGKVFLDWSVTGNATGSASTNTYTLKGNGSAGTGTLTANFGVLSGWNMEGEDFGGWDRPSTYKFVYPYRGMSGVYYIPTTLNKDKWWKVNNGSTPFNATNASTTVSKGTIYNLVEEWSNSSKVSTTLSNVWVVINTNDTKKIWVQDSQTFYNVNVSGADNDKGPVKVTLNTTTAFTKGDNVFETTQFANGEKFDVTVTGVSGYIPTIRIGSTDYTFWKEAATYSATGTMGSADVSVTISYTASYAVTFAKTTGCNGVTATGPSSTTITTGTKVKSGTSITFTQSAKTGYNFSSWNSKSTGDGTDLGGNSSGLTKSITTVTSVYPIYTEKSYSTTIAVSPTGTGTTSPAAGSQNIKQVSGTSVTATANTNYVFVNWTASGGGITPTSSTTNPQTFKATSTGGTITANFADKWNLKGDQWDNWATYKPLPNTGTNTFATTIELTKGTTYQFKVIDRSSNTWYGSTDGEGNKVFQRGDGAFTTKAGGMNNNLEVTPDVSGTYTFTINTAGSTPVFTLTFQPAYTVTFGYGTGGSAVTASGATDGAINSGDYVKAGDDVTFTQTASSTGYTFKGWYTSADGNTTVSGMSTSDNVLNSIAANANVYAQYTPNQYTVSFNKNGGGGDTPGNITVTYGQAYGTLPAGPTPPGADQFAGWFTAETGGTQVTAETIVSTASNHTLWARFESTFTVTVQYKCGTDVLRAQTTTHASETSVAAEITAPEILGYSFVNWTGDNATFADATSATTTVNVTSATTVVANYVAHPTLYFKNNLSWDDVYVTFNCNWVTAGGKQVPGNNGKPYFKMTQLGNSDIFYCAIPDTYTSSDYAGWKNNIAFDNHGFSSSDNIGTKTGGFDAGAFLGRGDFDPLATMFIPYDGDTESRNSGTYYRTGCWLRYNSTSSGYRVQVNEWKEGEHADSYLVDLTSDVAGGTEFKATVYMDAQPSGYEYGFKLYKHYQKNSDAIWYSNTGDIHPTTNTLPWHFWTNDVTATSRRCGLEKEAHGDYVFTVSFGTGRPVVNVTYPVSAGDYRLVYKDLATWSNGAHDANWNHPSRVIKKAENGKDTISFFISKATGANAVIKLQKCSAIVAGNPVWKDTIASVTLPTTGTGIYNFLVDQTVANGKRNTTVTSIGGYEGNYYIRSDASDGGWSNYKTSGANNMTYSEYSLTHGGDFGPYSHYFMRHVNDGSNIKFCIANDYSQCISDTVVDDTYAHEWIEAEANIRFMWYNGTNKIGRAYVSGSSIISDRFLVLEGDEHLYDADGNRLTGEHQIEGLEENEMKFIDDQNWIYETTVQANPLERVKLTAKFNGKVQYFYGAAGERTDANTHQLIGGTGDGKYKMRVVYDFKTNRLLAGWLPTNTPISEEFKIEADIMIIRYHQNDAQQVTFSGEGKLTDVKTVYGAMEFNKYRLNNQRETGGHDDLGLSPYERDLFFISFPFDVKLNDVFGFGQYGKHWIIEYYDGKTRAQNGYWKDSPTNWKFVTKAMKDSYTLKANEGYVLALDLDELKPESPVWNYGVENVYLYFPSTATVENIQATSKTVKIDTVGYQCKINRNTTQGDRRVKDSHWHLIGVPSYANANHSTSNSWSTSTGDLEQTIYYPNIDPAAWTSAAPFVYNWNASLNKFGVIEATSYSFKPMHSYLVQYARDTLEWRQVNTTVASAPRRAMFAQEPCDFRLELMQDENVIDQTFISMRDDEEVTAEFDFNYDLSKMLYGAFTSKSNIYTFAGNEEVAANCLPFKEETTVVPVGLTVDEEGEYIFSIPDGTSGVGVTLVDNERQIRTNLALTDYAVTLPAGTYDERFVIEISPIEQIVTNVELINGENGDAALNGVSKKLIDGVLYIVKDGKVFDARGARIQ